MLGVSLRPLTPTARALGGEPFGDGPSDALGGAGDQREAALLIAAHQITDPLLGDNTSPTQKSASSTSQSTVCATSSGRHSRRFGRVAR